MSDIIEPGALELGYAAPQSAQPMSLAEVRLLLSNERDMRERRYDEDTQSAFMYEAAVANADGVGHERRGFALDTALRFAARAARNRLLARALARALDLLPQEG